MLDGSLDGDVFFRNRSRHTLHPFTSLHEQCYECCILNIVQHILIVITHAPIQVVYSYYMLTPSMEGLWYVKFWHLCFKLEDQLIEWMTKGQAMALRINILRYNRFVFRQQLPFLWEKTIPLCLALVRFMAGRQAGWQTKYSWNSISWKFSTG